VSLFKLLNECKNKLLAEIKIPCLVLQSKTEHTVQPRSAEYIYNKLAAASSRRLVWFEHSGHILTLDREHEAVFKEIADFFAEEKDIEG
jgi:carboxylesterase